MNKRRQTPRRQQGKLPPHLFIIIGGLLFAFIFIKNAWVHEDAFITFRSVEQFFAGHGPRWNPHERTQVYTSVLWFWALLIFRLVSEANFFNTLILGALFSGGALIVARRCIGNDFWWFAALLALLNCKAFMDYTSSGFENPAAYFFLMLFLLFYLRVFTAQKSAGDISALRTLTVVTAFIPLVRHDISLLIAPAYLYAWLFSPIARQTSWRGKINLALLAAAPLLLWSLFALFYYGNPLPNTALSKTNMELPRLEIIAQGLGWLYVVLLKDTATLPLLLLCGGALLIWAPPQMRVLTLGVALFLIYGVWIGGDYILSRFLSAPLFLIVMATAAALSRQWLGRAVMQHRRALIAALVAFAVLYPNTPFKSPWHHPMARPFLYGVSDDHQFYYLSNSLYAVWQNGVPQGYPAWLNYQKLPPDAIITTSADGLFAYRLGLDKISISYSGLTDPFIARIPFYGHDYKNNYTAVDNPLHLPLNAQKNYWRAGHLWRYFPKGYPEVLVNESHPMESADVRTYWEKIKFITQGELFNWERVKTAILLNVGYYDHLLADLKNKKVTNTNGYVYGNLENHWTVLGKDSQGNAAWQYFKERPF